MRPTTMETMIADQKFKISRSDDTIRDFLIDVIGDTDIDEQQEG